MFVLSKLLKQKQIQTVSSLDVMATFTAFTEVKLKNGHKSFSKSKKELID